MKSFQSIVNIIDINIGPIDILNNLYKGYTLAVDDKSSEIILFLLYGTLEPYIDIL